jgi:hypothetical protein
VSTHDDDLVKLIAQHGWAVMRIAEEEDSPPFAYSIGLFRSFRHPEIIVLGLPSDTAHQLINDIGDAIRSGLALSAGQTSDAFLKGYSCTFRRVPPHQYPAYLGRGLRFYDHDPFPVLQLVYPDKLGRWPWQEGVTAGFRANQPVLADDGTPPWAQ